MEAAVVEELGLFISLGVLPEGTGVGLASL